MLPRSLATVVLSIQQQCCEGRELVPRGRLLVATHLALLGILKDEYFAQTSTSKLIEEAVSACLSTGPPLGTTTSIILRV